MYLFDLMIIEDNKRYSKLPNSSPQHHVGQILRTNQYGRKSIICLAVLDRCSLWKEIDE